MAMYARFTQITAALVVAGLLSHALLLVHAANNSTAAGVFAIPLGADDGPPGALSLTSNKVGIVKRPDSTAATAIPQADPTTRLTSVVNSNQLAVLGGGRRLNGLCISPAPQCQACLCKGLYCRNRNQASGTCHKSTQCSGAYPILWQGSCYSCPAHQPYFGCSDFKCHRCPQAYPNFYKGQCYACPNPNCQTFSFKDGKCYNREFCTTTSAVNCPEPECRAPKYYRSGTYPFIHPTRPNQCLGITSHGTLDFVDWDFLGGDYNDGTKNLKNSWAACKAECDASYASTGKCVAWTYLYINIGQPVGSCWLKDKPGQLTIKPTVGTMSGWTANAAINLPGQDYNSPVYLASAQKCAARCLANKPTCKAWSYVNVGSAANGPQGSCWIKNGQPNWRSQSGVASGTM